MAKPAGFVPAVQRYSARFDAGPHHLVVLTIGAQAPPGLPDLESAFEDFVTAIITRAGQLDGPMSLDHARFVDDDGYPTRLIVAYWSDIDRFRSWWASPAVRSWWESPERLTGPLGYFVEPAPVRTDALETVLFREYVAGLAACPVSSIRETGESGYWGAARDRIPRAGIDRFACPASADPAGQTNPSAAEPPAKTETRGRRIRVMPNQNHCLIRSGVSWDACGPTQLASYRENVLPRLNEGMAYLRTNAEASGCWSLRQVDVVAGTGEPAAESWVGAHFVSLSHLEAWAHHHPTHLAIYGQAQKERVKYQDDLELRTYHEVLIVEDPMAFEYQNCHPDTGGLTTFTELADEEN